LHARNVDRARMTCRSSKVSSSRKKNASPFAYRVAKFLAAVSPSYPPFTYLSLQSHDLDLTRKESTTSLADRNREVSTTMTSKGGHVCSMIVCNSPARSSGLSLVGTITEILSNVYLIHRQMSVSQVIGHFLDALFNSSESS